MALSILSWFFFSFFSIFLSFFRFPNILFHLYFFLPFITTHSIHNEQKIHKGRSTSFSKAKNTITVQKQSRSLKRQVKNIMNPNQMTRGIGSRGREERNFFTTIIFLTTKQIITSKMTTRRNSTPPAPPLMQCPLRREEDSNFISSLIA